jgi:pimeloyl-ACP methyl ester carboxylesterase
MTISLLPVQTRTALTWDTVMVDGQPARYCTAGSPDSLATVIFLHGWALANHSYQRSLEHLAALGVRVIAPALPGFGDTPELTANRTTMAGYAAWLAAFIRAVGIQTPVSVVGHSFGGGVAIQTAHDYPQLVGQLVLVNSIGGSVWRIEDGVVRTLAERPRWHWALHLRPDILPLNQLSRFVPVVLEDVLPNLLHHPRSLLRVANLVRHTSLLTELDTLRERAHPVTVVWGDRDEVLPEPTLQSLLAALGGPPHIPVPGPHGWLIGNPKLFAETISNVIHGSIERSHDRPLDATGSD